MWSGRRSHTLRHGANVDSGAALVTGVGRTATPRRRVPWLSTLLSTPSRSLNTDVALVATRVALVWIFTYYGAGKLFGAFNGPGIHRTSIYFATTAHLRPGGFFAVSAGIIEFGGALLIALGLGARLAGLALLVDQVMAMITVTWVNGINSLTNTPGYEFNLTLAVLALVVLALGAGRVSCDYLIDRRLELTALATAGP